MNNRLKLYDSTIYTYLNKKDKLKFRKLAFKNKMTVSEFNRYLILLVLKSADENKLCDNLEKTNKEVDRFLTFIGRNII